MSSIASIYGAGMTAVRTEDHGHVRELVLCRADEYNTITIELLDELSAALEAADRDREVRVVLVRAEGPAFCAGFGLDWSTAAQAAAEQPDAPRPVWDSVADLAMISTFART